MSERGAADALRNEPAEAGRPDGRPVILVVEPDRHVRSLLDHFLMQAGFAVEVVDDGATALARARRIRPRAVITEILLPGIDGLELCARLKRDPETADAPVFVFSMLTAKRRAEEAGADAYVPKPLSEGRLITTIERVLGDVAVPRSEEDG